MGKKSKAKKRRRLQHRTSLEAPLLEVDASGKRSRVADSDESASSDGETYNDNTAVSKYEVTVALLRYFGAHMHEYHTKRNKPLKRAIFPLIQAQQRDKAGEFDAAEPYPDISSEGCTGDLIPTNRLPSEGELDVVISTLTELKDDMGSFFSSNLSACRKALVPFIVDYESKNGPLPASTLGINARASQCFDRRDWMSLLSELRCMEIYGYLPPLGALQRWVRGCDDISPPAMANLISYQIMRLSKLCRNTSEPVECKQPMSCIIGEWGRHLMDRCSVIMEHAPVLVLDNGHDKGARYGANPDNAVILARALAEGSIKEICSRVHDAPDPYTPSTSGPGSMDSGKLVAIATVGHQPQSLIDESASKNRNIQQYNYYTNCAANKPYFVVQCIPGSERRPPSGDDLYVYATAPGTIKFDDVTGCESSVRISSSSRKKGGEVGQAEGDGRGVVHENNSLGYLNKQQQQQKVQLKLSRVDVPGVDGAFVLRNVLTPTECAQLIASAESLGYVSDAVEGIDALVWIADDSLLGPIFDRVKALLPQAVMNSVGLSNASSTAALQSSIATGAGKGRGRAGDCESSAAPSRQNIHSYPNPVQDRHEQHQRVAVLAGLNPRLRFFRYKSHALYHPHIDGSWKAGGFDEEGVYREELNTALCSRYTFLIYLNEGFKGGGTTFYGVEDESDPRCCCIFNNSLCTGRVPSEAKYCGSGGGGGGNCSTSNSDHGTNDGADGTVSDDNKSRSSASVSSCRRCTHKITVRSVQPQQGSVLCFPHGRAAGALVHEGSAVLADLRAAQQGSQTSTPVVHTGALGVGKQVNTDQQQLQGPQQYDDNDNNAAGLAFVAEGGPAKYVIRTDILFRLP